MKQKWLLVGVLFLAFLLRVIGLAHYPAGFNADEVNQGYTAYSILKTGKDEWGKFLPLAPRSYGDYRAPLYTYLTIPSVAIFGLSEFAVRLPNAIIGTLAVLVTYLLVVEILKDQKIALLASLLLAISPWSVMLSRGAFEPNLPTLLIPLGWLTFEKGKRKKGWFIVSGVVFGLSLFAYYSARFLVPLLIIFLWWQNKKQMSKVFLAVFGAFFLVAVSTMFFGGGARSADVIIANPTGGWGAVADGRYQAILLGLPDEISRAFNNKLGYTLTLFVSNYLSYFSPQFLFTQGAGEATYGMMPGIGLVYLFELPFILVALKDKRVKVLLPFLLLAPIPAALAKGPGYAANRAAVMMPFVQIISAIGAVTLWQRWSKKKLLIRAYFLLVGISLLVFLESYFFQAPAANARMMSYGWRETFDYLTQVDNHYDQIIISRQFSESQMYTAFYLKLDPSLVQEESTDWLRYEKEGLKFVDQLGEYRLGKFVYRTINPDDFDKKGILIVGRPADFPEEVEVTKSVDYPDGQKAIVVYAN